jgi:hypothetical protein
VTDLGSLPGPITEIAGEPENCADPVHLVSVSRDGSVLGDSLWGALVKPFCYLSCSREGDSLASERLIVVLIIVGEDAAKRMSRARLRRE